MAKHISDLLAGSALSGSELIEISQRSATVRVTGTTVSAAAADNSFNDSANGFLTAGFAVGDRVKVTGFANGANNALPGVVTSVTAGKMIVSGAVLVNEAAGPSVIVGKLISVRTSPTDIAALGITNEMVMDVIAAMLTAGAGITLTYNDAGDTFTIASSITQYTDEMAQDAIASMLTAGTGITLSYNDAANTYTITNAAPSGGAYTDENAEDAVAGIMVAGAALSITYNDAANTLTLAIVEATDSQVWTGTSSAVAITPKKIFDAAIPQTLTDAATIALDLATGINFKVTLGGNRTLANPTNAKTGQSGVIFVTQDATGSRTLSYGTNWRFPGGSASGGVLSTTASAIDMITYFVRSDGTIAATVTKAFAA